ncbi:MAG TPA: alpha/beta hydrolase-fold protein [Candidatus Binatia bacterium]|nr:alpha/beta hydrolase-fold protein [Candidatus Binatia bacterium]
MKVEETEDAIVVEPEQSATAAVIWLHGLGADGGDFVPLVPELRMPAGLPVRFVFPHAPVRPVTINGGAAMRAWYDILSLGGMARQDEAGIRDSERIVLGFLQQQLASGIAADKIVLAGFSQGGAIALQVGLRHPQKLAGVLALSTYLPLADSAAKDLKPERRDTPVLMCHGTHDPVLPMQLGSASRDLLVRMGFQVTWKQYPMQHEVCLPEIGDIADWLRQRLDPASRIILLR